MAEYQSLLAAKLLRNVAFSTGGEVATLELLKLRFGEAAMHQCGIMVWDVDESKRLNNSVRAGAHRPSCFFFFFFSHPHPRRERLRNQSLAL